MNLDAKDLSYRRLNELIRQALATGAKEVHVLNVRGQRYIGCGLNTGARLVLHGVPGNDLGAFMNGAQVVVRGNAQDGVGNTMNDGSIIVHGRAGDVLGHSMRGGRIFVRDDAGYRAGIHMKAYGDRSPIVVIGGGARDYLGEYMAGGMLVVLNRDDGMPSPVGEYVGTGMHGGTIFIRGDLRPYQLGREARASALGPSDWRALEPVLDQFCTWFELSRRWRADEFVKLTPRSTRPYGRLYAH